MMLYPPVRFDGNEWFIIVTGLITWSAIFWLPKRFSFLTILNIWLFNFFLAQMTDFIIGKPPLGFYYYNDIPKYEYFDFILYLVTYPPAAYFFDYFYDRWRFKGWQLAGYVLSWALVTTVLEWVSAKYFHIFTYTGWLIFYSFFVYILVYLLNLLVYRFSQSCQPGTE